MRRVQGWDPVLIISQIICMQTIHYLLLAVLIPPILSNLSSKSLLEYAGGQYSVSYILDWREMGSVSTAPRLPQNAAENPAHVPHKNRPTAALERRDSSSAFSGDRSYTVVMSSNFEGNQTTVIGSEAARAESVTYQNIITSRSIEGQRERMIAVSEDGHSLEGRGTPTYNVQGIEGVEFEIHDYGIDRKRGWLIGGAWIMACVFNLLPLYYLIRKPTLILDFSLTMVFVHVCATIYRTRRFPNSIFFWIVMGAGAVVMIVGGEQLCVLREMRQSLQINEGLPLPVTSPTTGALRGVDADDEFNFASSSKAAYPPHPYPSATYEMADDDADSSRPTVPLLSAHDREADEIGVGPDIKGDMGGSMKGNEMPKHTNSKPGSPRVTQGSPNPGRTGNLTDKSNSNLNPSSTSTSNRAETINACD